MDAGTANGLADVLGWALAAVGALLAAMPQMFRKSAQITQGLFTALTGVMVAVPFTLVLVGLAVGVGLADGAYHSLSEASADMLAATAAPLLFGLLAGFLVGSRGIRPLLASWRRTGVLIGIGVVMFGISAAVGLSGRNASRLYVVAFAYWFAVGGLIRVPILSIREVLRLGAVLIVIYAVLILALWTLLLAGPIGLDAAAVIEGVAFLIALGGFAGLYGFAFCNPAPGASSTPSIKRFLYGIGVGFGCGLLMPLLSLMVPKDPLGVLPFLSVPVALTIGLAGGQSRLLLYWPHGRWVRRNGRDVFDRDVALWRFGHGMLVGFFVPLLLGSLFWYSGTVVGSFLQLPGPPDRLKAVQIMLLAPFLVLPFALAAGLVEVLAPWLSYRVRLPERSYVVVGLVVGAVGGLITARASVLRLLGI